MALVCCSYAWSTRYWLDAASTSVMAFRLDVKESSGRGVIERSVTPAEGLHVLVADPLDHWTERQAPCFGLGSGETVDRVSEPLGRYCVKHG
jgi:hypothetical protein